MRKLLMRITFVLAVAFSALAQTAAAPDFSGTWVLNIAKSTLLKDSTIKSETIVIDNKKLAIVFHYKTDGKKSTETYTPDGKKRVTKDVLWKHGLNNNMNLDSALAAMSHDAWPAKRIEGLTTRHVTSLREYSLQRMPAALRSRPT